MIMTYANWFEFPISIIAQFVQRHFNLGFNVLFRVVGLNWLKGLNRLTLKKHDQEKKVSEDTRHISVYLSLRVPLEIHTKDHFGAWHPCNAVVR